MQNNPYRASELSEPIGPTSSTSPVAPDAAERGKLLLWSRLLLKLLGVMLVTDGCANAAFAMVYSLRARGFEEYPEYYVSESLFALCYAGCGGVLLMAGLYFISGGQWVVDKVFRPVIERQVDDV